MKTDLTTWTLLSRSADTSSTRPQQESD